VIIVDESDRVLKMAQDAFAGPGGQRDGYLGILREFCYSAASGGESELALTGNVGKAIQAAVKGYQSDRQQLIEFRRSKGWPTTDPNT
jgi:hypothetical protein